MSVNRTCFVAILCLTLGILIGIVVGSRMLVPRPKENAADIPRKVVTVAISPSQQDQLFIQLQRFSDKWQYATRIAPTDASQEYYAIDMWRSDIKVLGVYTDKSGTLQLAFSYTESTRPVPEQYFIEEVSDFQRFMGEIPGATFSIDK